MASDNGKKYILSDVEDFAKKNSFNDTFKIAKTWEEIGFHVSALSYNGFRVITLSRLGSGVFQLFFSGDTFLKTRYSLGVIHDVGITQWTKDYIDNPYGNYFQNNSIGNYVYYNTIGNGFGSNTIGNGFGSNTIGNYFQNNSIGNYVYYNTIGNSFGSNTIGNYFQNNSIGNNVSGLILKMATKKTISIIIKNF